MRYDQYDLYGDDPLVKCRRCGEGTHVDTLADAVVWAEAHELQCFGDDVQEA